MISLKTIMKHFLTIKWFCFYIREVVNPLTVMTDASNGTNCELITIVKFMTFWFQDHVI